MPSSASRKATAMGGWVKMTPAAVKAFSAESKKAIKEKVDKIIERHMKPLVLKRRGGRAAFGDVQDIYTKWHGHNLILIAKRRGGRVVGRYAEDLDKIGPAYACRSRYVRYFVFSSYRQMVDYSA